MSFLHCNKELCCRIWHNFEIQIILLYTYKKQTLKCEPDWEVGWGNKTPSYSVSKGAFILSSSWLNFRQASSWLPFFEICFRKLKIINPFSALFRCKSFEKPLCSFIAQECLSQGRRTLSDIQSLKETEPLSLDPWGRQGHNSGQPPALSCNTTSSHEDTRKFAFLLGKASWQLQVAYDTPPLPQFFFFFFFPPSSVL